MTALEGLLSEPKKNHSVKRLCQVLKLNRSSYYTWKKTAPTRDKRLINDSTLGAKIKTIFTKERGCYGIKRITASAQRRPRNNPGQP